MDVNRMSGISPIGLSYVKSIVNGNLDRILDFAWVAKMCY